MRRSPSFLSPRRARTPLALRRRVQRPPKRKGVSRYVDNAPPQEPHDVRAHMLGGVPNVEIEALNGLIAKYDIAPADIFSDRGDGYSDFLERCATKGMIKSYISDHAGVLSAKERMHGAFEDFWIEAALAVNSIEQEKDLLKKYSLLKQGLTQDLLSGNVDAGKLK